MFIFLLLTAILLLMSLIIALYRKRWSKNLTVDIRFEKEDVFEGDKSCLLQAVTNRKLLPFWWGDIQYTIPSFINLDDPDYHGREYFKDVVSAFSYQRVTKRIGYTATRRGYYRIDSSELLTIDFFYRYRMIRQYPVSTELYVYPDIRAMKGFSPDFRKITGEVVARRHYIEDPFQFRGIRDYYPFDSLKTVNWNATARSGEIKVNEYNCTSSQEACLLLDFDKRSGWDKIETREDCIRIAAYLTGLLLKNGVAVGLMSNACDVVSGEECAVGCRNGSGQQKTILRRLARLDTAKLSRPFPELLEARVPRERTDTQYILVSFACGDELQRKVTELRAGGHGIQWIFVSEKQSKPERPALGGVYVCEVAY